MPFNKTAFFLRSIRFYRKPLFMISLGAALTTMIITGALIIGDSVQGTLKKIALERTGLVQQVITSQERWFRADISHNLQEHLQGKFASVISLPAYVSVPQKSSGVAVNLYGVDDDFFSLNLNGTAENLPAIKKNDLFLNTKAKQLLNANVGTDIIVRILKPTQMPNDAPLSDSSAKMIAKKLTISRVITASEFGNFQLAATQQSVPTVFVQRSYLAEILNRSQRANILLTDQTCSLFDTFKKALSLTDYGLEIKSVGEQWELTSNRVYIAENVDIAAKKVSVPQQRILSYFVNEISFENKSVPYSFVAAFENLSNIDKFMDDGVLINQWLFEQLHCPIGARLVLKSYKIDNFDTLTEQSFTVKVGGIIPMIYPCIDSTLMPRFPGFEDTDSCSDWDPGLPIDLSRVRPEDEDYWNRYNGTPKIILPLSTAQKFWSNRFGSLTAIRFSKRISEAKLTQQLLHYLQPQQLGFRIIDLHKQSTEGVQHAVDFSGLFIGLSFFIIVSAIILTVLLYSFYIEKLNREYAVMNILGFRKRTILTMYLGQGVIFAVIGLIPGALMGYFYAGAIVHKLNTLWGGVVNQAHISLFVSQKSVLFGGLFSLSAVCLAVGLQSIRFIRSTPKKIVSGEINIKTVSKTKSIVLIAIFFIASIATLMHVTKTDQTSNIGYFILIGFFMFATITQLSGLLLVKWASTLKPITITSFALRNCARQYDRSMAVLRLLALAIFLTLSVGLNQQSFTSDLNKKTSGAGGFSHYIETAIPITKNLNSSEGRKFLNLSGLSKDCTFIHIPTIRQTDASCLNLNHVVNPNISGVVPKNFSGRFEFQKILDGVGTGWDILNYSFNEPDVIPVVSDMNVILWSLGKKLGDDLTVSNSSGEKYRLRFVGGLKNSIFQGRVLVSLENFYKLYPDSVGTNIILLHADQIDTKQIINKLSRSLSDYGLNLQTTSDRLNEFNSVQNTYLAMFLALGGIGLILGCGGLMVLIQRNMYERQAEITYLRIAGYSRKNIYILLGYEYIVIFSLAVVCGLVAAGVAVWPSLPSIRGMIILANALSLIGLLIVLGIVSILLAIRGNEKMDLKLLKDTST